MSTIRPEGARLLPGTSGPGSQVTYSSLLLSARRADEVAKDASDKWIQTLLQIGSDEIGAVLRAEDGVIEILGVCAGHDSPPSALRAEENWGRGSFTRD